MFAGVIGRSTFEHSEGIEGKGQCTKKFQVGRHLLKVSGRGVIQMCSESRSHCNSHIMAAAAAG